MSVQRDTDAGAGSLKLARLYSRRAIQVLRVAAGGRSLPDAYDALGLAVDYVAQADELLCSLPDEALGIVDGHKAQVKGFDDLVTRQRKGVRRSAAAHA